MSIQDRLTYLLEQALKHTATEPELQELSELIRQDDSGNNTRHIEALLQQQLPDNATAAYDLAYWDEMVDKILSADKPPNTAVIPLHPRKRLRWIPAAAAILLLLSAGIYWFLQPDPHRTSTIAVTPPPKQVVPGGNNAMLILADGTALPLDSAGNGALAQQGNTRISQATGGQLLYTFPTEQPPTATVLQYNTLRTPKGGQFQVTLADGTKVWLNAASSLKYPVAFNGAYRQVELTGEAYFDVATNAAMPFKVAVHTGQQSDSLEVVVLGTQFNIMAYTDESLVKTTLLEGAVKVNHNGNSRQLRHGQGAQLDKQKGLLSFQQLANTEEAIAWKNGLIQLEGNDIGSVMRMIARWYNVEIVFTAPVPAHFRGSIPRNLPLAQVLKILEMTGEVHFQTKDRQIIVSP
ncbi:FecR domain-containing protein [Chitinophaga pendula]|uniref:FecR family protein n=1 Tax=Chitinophaga TaxID=79328 RepID=UPI000BAEBA91|nr:MULTISPECIES: FecR family protein [Chitinophaga]ASZ12492.1 hypothetical protein CK934_16775 [Chitinophaga sp. MD30]UCJ09907.1 FecR domain-containing protein [Chitinophaga pendula]